MLPDKVEECRTIPERLCAALFGCGIGSNRVCIGEAILKFRAGQELVDEPRGETISGADIIHGLHTGRNEAELLLPGPANGCRTAAFHNYNLRQSSERVDRLRKVLGAGGLLRLTIIGKKDIYVLENVQEITIPFVFGIVVRIQGS